MNDLEKAFQLWQDRMLYGFSAVDKDGNRIDPTTIRPVESKPLGSQEGSQTGDLQD